MGYVFRATAARLGTRLALFGACCVLGPWCASGFAQTPGGPAARRLAEVRPTPVVVRAPIPSVPATTPPASTRPTGLAEVRLLFGRLDRDARGTIDRLEAQRAGVHAMDFLRFDDDRSGSLSRDEFTFGVHEILNAAGRPVAPDLGADATRVLALRRARALEARRLEQARSEAQRIEELRRQTAPTGPGGARTGTAPPVRVLGGSPPRKDDRSPQGGPP